MHFKSKHLIIEFYLCFFSKLLNKPFASCSFTNLDFLILQAKHYNCVINLLFFVLTVFGSTFSVSFLHFTQ